jgi:hypothetical protein
MTTSAKDLTSAADDPQGSEVFASAADIRPATRPLAGCAGRTGPDPELIAAGLGMACVTASNRAAVVRSASTIARNRWC